MRSLAVLAFVTLSVASGQGQPDVLARMDRTAKEFKSFTARMKRVDYTAILQESEEVNGIVRLQRTPQGLVGLMEFSEPKKAFSEAMPAEIVHLNGRTVERYFPKAATVEIWDAGKYASSLDGIVLLGFGTEIAKLRQSYDVKPGAMENVGSVPTTKVTLVPKTKDLKNLATLIELWIPEGKGYPIQEKISEPSKNYKLFTYYDLQMPAPADANFDLKVPPGTKEIHPAR